MGLPPYTLYLSGVRNDVTDAVAGLWEGPEGCPLGLLAQPHTRDYVWSTGGYDYLAIDNGLFTPVGQRRFRLDLYLDMVREAAESWGDYLLFATAPDVPFDWHGTLAKSLPVLPQIRAAGAPAAIVAQNGATLRNIPWDACDAVFLGGGIGPDTGGKEWKITTVAKDITREAHRRRKWVHMGRVNSAHRMKIAQDFGCDSADGTYLRHATQVAVATYAVQRLAYFTAHRWAQDEERLTRAISDLELLRGEPPSVSRGVEGLRSAGLLRSKNVAALIEAIRLSKDEGEDFEAHRRRRKDALDAVFGQAVEALAKAENRPVGKVADEVRSIGERLAVGDIVGWLATLRKRLVREKSSGLGLPRDATEALMFQHYGVAPSDDDLRENPAKRTRR